MKDVLPYVLPIIVHTVRYFLFAGVPFLVFYILFPDSFSKNKIQARVAQHKDFLREIAHSMQTVFILVIVGMLILKSPLGAYTQLYRDLSEHTLWWIPISVLLALVLHDTYFYWMHRIVHHPKLYKRIHLVHHQSVNPSPWASYSFHFLEGVLEAMVAPLILFLVPMHPIALILFGLSSFIINVYGHLGYEIAPRWFRHSLLFEILNTSTHHNLHHAKFHGNYGLYFRVWDRLMGTEYPDYVKEYDLIQARRFGEYTPSGFSWAGRLSILLLLLLCCSLVMSAGNLTGIDSEFQGNRKGLKRLCHRHPFGKMNHLFNPFSLPDSESIYFPSLASPTPNIEGKWKYDANGAVLLIYKADGLYYGKLIDAGNEEDNQKLKAHGNLLILKDFQKTSQAAYCCGTIFAPKKKKTISGTITLESANTLRIDGQYGFMTGSETLKRVVD